VLQRSEPRDCIYVIELSTRSGSACAGVGTDVAHAHEDAPACTRNRLLLAPASAGPAAA